ncbi:MAG: glucose 1-dehydrogenase [Xanthobacteraceae bacterium]
MRAITLIPGVKDSARLEDMPEPPLDDGSLLVRTLALGVCATDRDIVAAEYGEAPPGHDRLILGHESLGVVEQASHGPFAAGDHVVGIVRRPDPVPCPACAAGEWDLCRNGLYTERGIKARHGFGSERFRVEPEFAVRVDASLGMFAVLLEPTSIVAKAWDHVERIGKRARWWRPRSVLITGAGPIGLLAALIGAQRNLELHVFDRNRDGPKPALVRELGGTHHASLDDIDAIRPDIVMECTGAAAVIGEILGRTAPDGIACLLSVTPSHVIEMDIGLFNRKTVLDNDVMFGAVNANRSHYEMAAQALAQSDRSWLERLITRRVPLERWGEALERRYGDIKTIIDFTV